MSASQSAAQSAPYARRYYETHASKLKAAARARHQRKRPHLPGDELDRLRRPENRLEALAYGPSKNHLVCLNCGGLFDGNLSRHPVACPTRTQSSAAYKEKWGYAKSNPLASSEWRKRKSEILAHSEKFKAVVTAHRSPGPGPAAFTKYRADVAAAKKSGAPIRRGPMREEAILKRSAGQRGKPRKLRKPEVTDSQIERILALDLPIAEAARRAGLSPTAFYWRARIRHGWNARDVKSRRSLVNKYVFALRGWIFSRRMVPSVQDVTDRHIAGLRSDAPELFQQFRPFFPHLETELKARPQWLSEMADRKVARLKNNQGQLVLANAVIALASRIFKRSRSASPSSAEHLAPAEAAGRRRPKNPGPQPGPREAKKDFMIGKAVEQELPTVEKLCVIVATFPKRARTNVGKLTELLKGKGYSKAQIGAVSRAPGTPLKAARWVVSLETGLEYDSVATYHKRFRRTVPAPEHS